MILKNIVLMYYSVNSIYTNLNINNLSLGIEIIKNNIYFILFLLILLYHDCPSSF